MVLALISRLRLRDYVSALIYEYTIIGQMPNYDIHPILVWSPKLIQALLLVIIKYVGS